MTVDLSIYSHPITDQFTGSEALELSDDQVSFFHESGYLSGLDLLTVEQLAILRSELDRLMPPQQASNPLFYEFPLNESTDSGRILFHALGAWRISEAFHDLIFH